MNHKSNMNVGGESHGRVVPAKRPNKDGKPSAEGAEGRRPTKENTEQTTAPQMGKAPQSLSYFQEALNWQVWQVGFLFVLSMQFDSEKPDKITRGAHACNDDKVIFENPLNSELDNPEFYFREAEGV